MDTPCRPNFIHLESICVAIWLGQMAAMITTSGPNNLVGHNSSNPALVSRALKPGGLCHRMDISYQVNYATHLKSIWVYHCLGSVARVASVYTNAKTTPFISRVLERAARWMRHSNEAQLGKQNKGSLERTRHSFGRVETWSLGACILPMMVNVILHMSTTDSKAVKPKRPNQDPCPSVFRS